jgi:hypothetical protein
MKIEEETARKVFLNSKTKKPGPMGLACADKENIFICRRTTSPTN